MDPNLSTLDRLLTADIVVATGEISGVPTPGVFTPGGGVQAVAAPVLTRFDWTAAQVVALGNVATGNLPICTLPKGFYLTRAIIVLDTQASGVTTLTVSLGTAATTYNDLITAQDGLGTPGTLAVGTISDATVALAADLDVFAQFLTTTGAEKVKDVVGSSGHFYIEGMLLP